MDIAVTTSTRLTVCDKDAFQLINRTGIISVWWHYSKNVPQVKLSSTAFSVQRMQIPLSIILCFLQNYQVTDQLNSFCEGNHFHSADTVFFSSRQRLVYKPPVISHPFHATHIYLMYTLPLFSLNTWEDAVQLITPFSSSHSSQIFL